MSMSMRYNLQKNKIYMCMRYIIFETKLYLQLSNNRYKLIESLFQKINKMIIAIND